MNWFCIHTHPRREAQVQAYCRERLGLETYLPLLRRFRTIRRVRRIVTDPLFPGYLFCRFDPALSYRAVRYAPDAIGLVLSGGRPAVLADDILAELREGCDAALLAGPQPDPLHQGSSVQIVDGPLRGLTGRILRARDDDARVEVMLTLLREGAKVLVSRQQLELAAAD